MHDKAYTYLKMHVDEIRLCGKFVFRKDKEHVAKYTIVAAGRVLKAAETVF